MKIKRSGIFSVEFVSFSLNVDFPNMNFAYVAGHSMCIG